MSCRVMVLGASLLCGAFGLAVAADEKVDIDTKAMRGVWAYESMEWNGKKVPAEQIKMSTITFEEDKFTIKVGEKVVQSGTYKFDSTKSPKAVDATVTEGDGKGNMIRGIYK